MTAGIAGTDGVVQATALSSDGRTLYIGGAFTRVGQPTGSFVPVDAITGAVASHLNVNGSIAAQVPDGSGGWYIAGSFTTVGGTTHPHVAHLNADGSLDGNFIAAANLQVTALALNGGDLYLAGCAGLGSCFVADVDAFTGNTTRWIVQTDGAAGRLALGGSSLYLGGAFQHVGQQNRLHLAAVDARTGAVLTWNPNPDDGTGNSSIHAIVPRGDTVYVGGQFQRIGGAVRNSLAALDAVGGLALTWDAALGPATGPGSGWTQVYALALDGAGLYVGGSFTSAGGAARGGVALLDALTGAALPWSAGLTLAADTPPLVSALAVNADRVFIGGEFMTPGSTEAMRVAALDKNTAAPLSWVEAGQNAAVTSLSVAGSQVMVGGNFALLNGQRRSGMAAIDLITGQVTGWNPSAGGTQGGFASRLLVAGSTVYASGAFKRSGSDGWQSLVALDASTGATLPWNPLFTGGVSQLAASSTTLYVAGSLTSVNGQPRSGLASFDLASGRLTDWAPDATGAGITRLIASDSAVYLGGSFGSINGQPRSGLAALDPVSGALLSWNPNVESRSGGSKVVDMALDTSGLYIVGGFDHVGGQNSGGLAAVDASTGALLPWAPMGVVYPRAVSVSGDRVYVALNEGGGSPPAQAVLTLSISKNATVSTNYVLEGWADSIVIAPSGPIFAGQFTDSAGGVSPNLAHYLP